MIPWVSRAHWRYTGNTIELVLTWVQPNPQAKRQIDLFSRFCAAHGKTSYILCSRRHFPQNCPFLWGIWTPSNSRLLRPVLPCSRLLVLAHNSSVSASCSDTRSRPHPIMVSWAHSRPQPKRHLERFSRFCRAH